MSQKLPIFPTVHHGVKMKRVLYSLQIKVDEFAARHILCCFLSEIGRIWLVSEVCHHSTNKVISPFFSQWDKLKNKWGRDHHRSKAQ